LLERTLPDRAAHRGVVSARHTIGQPGEPRSCAASPFCRSSDGAGVHSSVTAHTFIALSG